MLIRLREARLNPNDRKRLESAKPWDRRLGGRRVRNIDHFRKVAFRFARARWYAAQLSWKSADPPRTPSSAEAAATGSFRWPARPKPRSRRSTDRRSAIPRSSVRSTGRSRPISTVAAEPQHSPRDEPEQPGELRENETLVLQHAPKAAPFIPS
jgi:hypothetical protein